MAFCWSSCTADILNLCLFIIELRGSGEGRVQARGKAVGDDKRAADLYRRSMYWFWKRSAPPASMDILNAPSRELCTIQRERTNTPLQALVTLNDPQFIEAARSLADEALFLGGGTDDDRFDFIARRLLSRPLEPAEQTIVKQSLAKLTAWYQAHPEDAKAVITIGASQPEHDNAVLLASWTMLTNQLMNLDEVLCK